ncbi:MAG: 16S rRNA (cytidine(1402)-2'-O)-methyltransferase [Lachnospiraceae bacterium]|nr:16S rRNA (cytidine(1402)-2'-O)-methyltransferase [Lachnospiraceae bacterium]
MPGKLYLVATPIGNLEDMTVRAVRVLREADIIAAEDTRNSIKLLNHFDIHTPMTSYHEFNKYDKADTLVQMLLEGKNVAAISDAGMPGISDPGYELVVKAREAGIEVSAVPGACAAITGLVISGLPTRRFTFEGFLPVSDNKLLGEALERLKRETATIIIYEAPHRLVKTLGILLDSLGDRRACLCRELTKRHEEASLSTLSQILARYETDKPLGECVLVIEGADERQLAADAVAELLALKPEEHVMHYMSQGMERMDAMKAAAKDRGMTKRELYKLLNG